MKKKSRLRLASASLAVSICTLMIPACAPKQAIDASAMEVPLKAVIARHDAYVIADDKLTEPERTTALRSSAILTSLVEEALMKGTPTPE